MAAPIVVGGGQFAAVVRALDWALAEYRWRRAPLRLVHTADPRDPLDDTGADAAGRVAAEEIVARAGAYARAARPEVELTSAIRQGDAAGRLVDESAEAAIVVVGHRRAGGFPGLLLGSVGHAAIHHAACPVAVVHPAA